MVCIMTSGQQGTESNYDITKAALNSFIPEQYRTASSFTWNFEDETFSVNQDYTLPNGCIMTKECFVPKTIISMPGLGSRYEEFIAIIRYEQVDLMAELPAALKKILGLE